MHSESHLSDQELLQSSDGELGESRSAEIASHLAKCWSCRARKQELDDAVIDFVHFYYDRLDPALPPVAGSRAMLKAQLAAAANPAPGPLWARWQRALESRAVGVAACVVVICVAVGLCYEFAARSSLRSSIPVSMPKPSLTPGAVIRIDRDQVCRSEAPKNRVAPVALQRKVFEEYGIQGAAPEAYEVDYLITPALGGADDIRNLWPQSNSSAVWNAHVKDALEDRMRELVCRGNLDLDVAQREIASDWIAAYKKYFHTSTPLYSDR